MARGGDDLPLVDQVDIAAQRRRRPAVLRHAHAGMRRGLGAHANLHARRHAGLAAVDAGHADFGDEATPVAVGQDHRLADDQVQRRAALALADANGLVAARFTHAVGTVAVQPEVVVRPVEVLGLAANHFALGFEVLGQAEGKGQFGRETVLGHGLAGQRGHRDDLVELIVAQVGGDRHALDPGLGAEHCQRRFVVADVQADRRAVAAFGQGVALHHLVGQHRDLVARHVDRGQALAGELVDRRIGSEGQRRRGNVHAKDHGAGLQAVDRQRIVDLGGLRVVDRERLHWGQRQLVLDRRCGQHRETRALGELLEQKALPVKLVR